VLNQHGALAMLIVPFAVGALDAELSWRHLPLLFAWLVGCLALFAAGVWLRSRGKRRYWPPVRTYGVRTVVLGLVAIAVAPHVLHWVVVLLPLLAFSLWCSWRRADRSVFNDGVTVLAGRADALDGSTGVGHACTTVTCFHNVNRGNYTL
jgi:hypothetical protein